MAGNAITVTVDDALLAELRELAASTGRDEAEVVEDAVRRHLASRHGLQTVLARMQESGDTDEAEALADAYDELGSEPLRYRIRR